MNEKYTVEELKVLADMVMDTLCDPSLDADVDVLMKAAASGTGWTERQFSSFCRRYWNGPDHVQ